MLLPGGVTVETCGHVVESHPIDSINAPHTAQQLPLGSSPNTDTRHQVEDHMGLVTIMASSLSCIQVTDHHQVKDRLCVCNYEESLSWITYYQVEGLMGLVTFMGSFAIMDNSDRPPGWETRGSCNQCWFSHYHG